MKFVDYAWWQVSPAQLHTMGFSGAMRYGVPGNTKSATIPEVAFLRNAGFDFALVYETAANRAAQGFAAGHGDAVMANGFADKLGYPKDATLFYAVDFDANPSQVQPYFDGIGSITGRPYAPYGSYRVVNFVTYSAPWGWQTEAWSYDYSFKPARLMISKRAGLLQDGFHDTYDSNTVLAPDGDFGQWRAHPPSPPSSPVSKSLLIPVFT